MIHGYVHKGSRELVSKDPDVAIAAEECGACRSPMSPQLNCLRFYLAPLDKPLPNQFTEPQAAHPEAGFVLTVNAVK